MGNNRIVGLDLVKGIAIFMMIIVHAVTQVIADYDGSIFLSVIDRIPKIVLYCVIYPLALVGLWGTTFTVVTSITTTLSVLRILDTNKRAFGAYLFQRWLFLVVLRLAESTIDSFLNQEYDVFMNSRIVIPPIVIAGPATTLDAIGWGGLVAPIVVALLHPIMKNKWKTIAVFFVVVFSLFAISPSVESWFAYLSKASYAHGFGLCGDIFGKVAFGRFKIAQTSAFAVAGALFGYLIYKRSSIAFQIFVSFILFVLCVATFIVWSIVDSSFFDHIADENVPLPAQIFSLGCECFFIYVHVYFVDGDRDITKRLRSRRRCTYLFRLGMLSLTVFCIGSWAGRKLALPWKLVFGPPCTHDPPSLNWNAWVCVAFTLFVLFVWLGAALLWEKVDFRFSLEHVLSWMMAKMAGKTYTPNTRRFVYGPAEELAKELDAEVTTELIVK